jgi:hypothetical protein
MTERSKGTWQEEVLSNHKFHEEKLIQFGPAQAGAGWSLRDSARELNVSLGKFHEDLKIGDAFIKCPEMIKIPKRKTVKEIVFNIQKEDQVKIEFITGIPIGVPIANTMIFENEYPPELRLSLHEKIKLLNRNDYSIYMLLNNQLVGEIYGFPWHTIMEHIPNVTDGIYCYSNTILSSYQGKGYGKLLKSYWMGWVLSSEYDKICGHCNMMNGSKNLNAFFGAEFGEIHWNWMESKIPHQYYEIKRRVNL